LRSDNDSAFRSWLFRCACWLLGIRHRRTTPHCPWENGRIERLFLTLKQKIEPWFQAAGLSESLAYDLALFRAWYNHARPHQHLDGRTPAMAWAGLEHPATRRLRFFSAWGGRLSGYIVPT
jgi:transposase InsO family protein